MSEFLLRVTGRTLLMSPKRVQGWSRQIRLGGILIIVSLYIQPS